MKVRATAAVAAMSLIVAACAAPSGQTPDRDVPTEQDMSTVVTMNARPQVKPTIPATKWRGMTEGEFFAWFEERTNALSRLADAFDSLAATNEVGLDAILDGREQEGVGIMEKGCKEFDREWKAIRGDLTFPGFWPEYNSPALTMIDAYDTAMLACELWAINPYNTQYLDVIMLSLVEGANAMGDMRMALANEYIPFLDD